MHQIVTKIKINKNIDDPHWTPKDTQRWRIAPLHQANIHSSNYFIIRFVKHTHVHLWFLTENTEYIILIEFRCTHTSLNHFSSNSKPLKWNYKYDNFIIIFWIYDCILFQSKRVNKKKNEEANVEENGIFPFILSPATHHHRSPAWLWIEWNNCFGILISSFFFGTWEPEVAHKQPKIKLSINFGFCPRWMHSQSLIFNFLAPVTLMLIPWYFD